MRLLKQKFETIKQLVNLNFDNNEPYQFISDVQLVRSTFDYLKIEMDTIIQYFVWYRLPKEYQDHLVHITGKTYPTVADIEEDIYEAVDRIASGISPIETEEIFSEPASLAANVSSLDKKSNFSRNSSFSKSSSLPKNSNEKSFDSLFQKKYLAWRDEFYITN